MTDKEPAGHETAGETRAVPSRRRRRLPGKLVALSIAGAIILLVAGGVLGYLVAPRGEASPPEPSAAPESAATESAPTMWTCSMHPQIRQPKPGKCPLCGMDLIPVTKTSGGLRTLTVTPEARALMSIETSPVERRYVTHEIRMVGKVDYDETKLGYITAWVSGRLDRLYVDYTGVPVRKGDHMVYIYSEDLYSAQQELIQAVKFARQRGGAPDVGAVDLVKSAREKLRLLGLKDDQINEIEKQDKPSDHLTIYSPVGGIVVEKLRQEGERVKTGDRIYTIADLNVVWVHLDAYESDLPWIRYGQDVTITTEAYPGEEFHGSIAFIQPVLNDKTRTVMVRVNVPNREGKLKPEMFVHAVVRPKVAAGGRVMDPSLAGKWICPMHPEVVKDKPGDCDTCGMPLVRAESLGYVTAESDKAKPPLVVPYSAILPTGTRAVVYLELPSMPSFAEPAFRTLAAVLKEGTLPKIREAFGTFAEMLDRPYDQPGTDYAKKLWNRYADRLGRYALSGQRASSTREAKRAFEGIDAAMTDLGEQFAPLGRPTFEGREILLGPRAGDYQLVRHGLEEGELVVTQGNFKIDSEVQIQAKPSMMTPEGGGSKTAGEPGAGGAVLPTAFRQQVRDLYAKYQAFAPAVEEKDLGKIKAAFGEFGKALGAVDGELLVGKQRMLWKELAMLLGNDAVEGQDAKQLAEADRVYLLLKSHVRRLRDQMGIAPDQQPEVEQIAVAADFQAELAAVWERYRAVDQALAADRLEDARQALTGLRSATAAVEASTLDGHALQVWNRQRAELGKAIAGMEKGRDIKTTRDAFAPLSRQIGVLAKTFGFGKGHPVYELHCPMALGGRGAFWYQDNDIVRNPYFGSSMLKCADRVEPVVQDEASAGQQPSHP
jgi:multidrug efflux pump subunit AcrA (membrane-fusion protein)